MGGESIGHRSRPPHKGPVMFRFCVRVDCRTMLNWGPFPWCRFHPNSNLVEISHWFHSKLNQLVATKFCTWHDNWTVKARAKYVARLLSGTGYSEINVRRIWITAENLLVTLTTEHYISEYLYVQISSNGKNGFNGNKAIYLGQYRCQASTRIIYLNM